MKRPVDVEEELQVGRVFAIFNNHHIPVVYRTEAEGLGEIPKPLPLDPRFDCRFIEGIEGIGGKLDVIAIPVELQHAVLCWYGQGGGLSLDRRIRDRILGLSNQSE